MLDGFSAHGRVARSVAQEETVIVVAIEVVIPVQNKEDKENASQKSTTIRNEAEFTKARL